MTPGISAGFRGRASGRRRAQAAHRGVNRRMSYYYNRGKPLFSLCGGDRSARCLSLVSCVVTAASSAERLGQRGKGMAGESASPGGLQAVLGYVDAHMTLQCVVDSWAARRGRAGEAFSERSLRRQRLALLRAGTRRTEETLALLRQEQDEENEDHAAEIEALTSRLAEEEAEAQRREADTAEVQQVLQKYLREREAELSAVAAAKAAGQNAENRGAERVELERQISPEEVQMYWETARFFYERGQYDDKALPILNALVTARAALRLSPEMVLNVRWARLAIAIILAAKHRDAKEDAAAGVGGEEKSAGAAGNEAADGEAEVAAEPNSAEMGSSGGSDKQDPMRLVHYCIGSVKDSIETSGSGTGQDRGRSFGILTPLQQLQHRTCLLVWSLFAYFHDVETADNFVDLCLERYYVHAMENAAPWLVRYLVGASLLSPRRDTLVAAGVLSEVRQLEAEYSDDLTKFVNDLTEEFDFPVAYDHLQAAFTTMQNDVILHKLASPIEAGARQTIFEVYCRLHNTIDLGSLSKYGISTEECKKWLVEFSQPSSASQQLNSYVTRRVTSGFGLKARLDGQREHATVVPDVKPTSVTVADMTSDAPRRAETLTRHLQKVAAQEAPLLAQLLGSFQDDTEQDDGDYP